MYYQRVAYVFNFPQCNIYMRACFNPRNEQENLLYNDFPSEVNQ